MATDPGDLVLDPTCGSGTTANVAEQWGRRWITIDTSRVALALARSRIMSARYPYYFLADSLEGRDKEADVSGVVQPETSCHNDIRQGFRASGKDDIAAWFIDTDYDEESFFVRHAYFLGANDPYKSLKSALKAEIDPEAWASLYRDVSQPFAKPTTGRFAVKVINHFGDEVMKVFGV